MTKTEAKKAREKAGEKAKKAHDEIKVEFDGRRAKWLEKFSRRGSKIVLAAALTHTLSSCSAAAVVPDKPERPDPMSALQANCLLDKDSDTVTCDATEFVKAGLSIFDQQEALARCRVELEKRHELGAIDLAEERGFRLDAEAKLADPWRSPWIWGIVGAAAGGVAATALVLGTQ
jgi:hypothetical protein